MTDASEVAAQMLEAYRKRKKKPTVLELELKQDTGRYWDHRLERELTDEEYKTRIRKQSRDFER